MLAGRVLGAADKQAITPLLDGQRLAAVRAGRAFEHLLDVTTGWSQGADVIAGRIGGATEEGTMLALADHQLGPTLRARFALEGMFVG